MESFTPKRLELIQALLEKQGLRVQTDGAIPRRREGEPAPLSFGQERLWFLSRMAPTSPVFNIPALFHLEGAIDRGLLERALAAVVARHETLRTVFPVAGGRPEQVVLEAPPAGPEFVDLTELPVVTREKEALARSRLEARRVFDLERGPLFRLVVFRLEEQRHLLLLVIHHIVAEIQSLGVFVRDLAGAYAASMSRETTAIAPLPIQFADFAAWQRERMQGERLASGLAFWEERLHGPLPVLGLATDRPRPPVQTFHGATSARPLPAEVGARVLAFARTAGVTPFTVFAAAWGALLSRLSGQRDILIGVPFTDRERPEVQDLVGFFVNTLVLRLDLTGNVGFLALVRRLNEGALAARAHQDFPFERLVEALGGTRDLSRSPIFQVAFLYQSAAESELARARFQDGFSVRPYEDPLAVHTGTSKFDASLVVWDQGGTFVTACEYSSDLLDASSVDRMLGQLAVLLESALADPELPIAGLELLTAEEQTLIASWNDTARDVPESACIHELFADQARRTPQAPAVVAGDVVLSYAELDERSNRLAHHLASLGVGTEDVVAIATERSPEMVVGMLGVLKAGAAYLPLDLGYPPARLSTMLTDARVRIVLTRAEMEGQLPEHAGTTLALDRDWPVIARQSGAPPEHRAHARGLCYVIYTSGSTGIPKGVELEHRGLVNLCAWHRRSYDVGPGQRATHLAGLAFDAAVWEIWPYLTGGASLVLVPDEVRLVPARIVEFFVQQSITHCFLPTPLAEAFLLEPLPADLPLRYLLTGGDKLHRSPQRELTFKLVNHYGPTENTVVATACVVAPRPGDERAPPIGRPIDNVQAFVLDASREPVGIGVPGELFLGGKSLARGYHRRPELTLERFPPHPRLAGERLYATGDIVRWTPDGELEFLERRDEQVKVRGFRVELGEVEARLANHPDLSACAVTLRRDPQGLGTLVGYAVPRPGKSVSTEGLRAYLGETLPQYMLPNAFVFLGELPLSPSGKVDRNALPAPEPASSEGHQFEAPAGELEEALARAWRNALGIERVDAATNFFELGGHSLLLVRVHAELQKTVDPALSIVDLFRYPTIRALAIHILAARAGEDRLEKSSRRGALRRAAREARSRKR